MFDLKQKIEAWRDEQLKHNALSYADVAELQAHLEFSIDDLTAVGLSEEEAFYVAKHRLGDPHALIDEYGKVNPAPIWRKRFLWLVSGYFLLGAIPAMVNVLIFPIYYFEIKDLLYPMEFLYGQNYTFPIPILLVIFLFLGGAISYFLQEQNGEVLKSKLVKLGHKITVGIIAGYVVLFILNLILRMLLTRVVSVQMAGNAFASGSLFGLVWQLFLLIMGLSVIFASRRNRMQHKLA